MGTEIRVSLFDFADIIFCKQILLMCHSLELQIVATWVLKEHRQLLSRLPHKSQMRLHDEFHSVFQAVSKLLPLLFRQDYAEVWNRHVLLAHLVKIIHSTIL